MLGSRTSRIGTVGVSLDSHHGPVAGSVSYGWGWQPPGFRCTDDSGVTTTSLWF